MKSTSNVKDVLSNICGFLFAISSGLVTANVSGLDMPTYIVPVSGVVMATSGAVIGWLTGKAPNAAKKTDDQLSEQNVTKP